MGHEYIDRSDLGLTAGSSSDPLELLFITSKSASLDNIVSSQTTNGSATSVQLESDDTEQESSPQPSDGNFSDAHSGFEPNDLSQSNVFKTQMVDEPASSVQAPASDCARLPQDHPDTLGEQYELLNHADLLPYLPPYGPSLDWSGDTLYPNVGDFQQPQG